MIIRMRCPSCRYEADFGVDPGMPVEWCVEVGKEFMRCKCRDHIPKIDKHTPIEDYVISGDGVPLKAVMYPKGALN